MEWARGKRLGKNNDKKPDVINVCYADHRTPQPYAAPRWVVSLFEECLLSYGTRGDVVVNYSVANN